MNSLKTSPIGTTIVVRGHDHRFGQDYEVEAYMPEPLPREVQLSDATWNLIGDAMAELGRLDAAADHVPNPGLLVRVATRLEAVGTSALEGTYAEITEVFAAEALPEEDDFEDEVPQRVKEVINYIRAADMAYDWISTAPLTRSIMSTLQAQLVRGTESDGPEAGDVRKSQVFIGPKDRPITEARFVPPPPGDQLEALYDGWFDWVREDRNPPDIQVLVHTALAHYQFETIHPYNDGNGRVGRLAAVLQIMRSGALNHPVLSISPWLRENENDYKDHLLNLSATGEWEPWITFFVEALIVESRRAQNRIRELLDLRDSLSEEVRQLLPRGRLAVDVVDDLIEFPIVSVGAVGHRYDKSNQAARNAVNRLIELGLLEPFNDAKYDRLYWNPRVFQIIQRS